MVTDKGIVPVKGGQYKILSEEQIKDLHNATVEVLNEVGIKMLHPEALEIMKSNGCKVDFKKQIVKIPDMRALDFAGSSPESTLLHMASAQMAHYYHLPYYGSNTPDSKLPDAQMGYERAQHFLGCALGGVNIIHVAIGNLEMMKLASYEQCLIDNEILGATFRLLEGIDCSREAIGLDVFQKVGHSSRFLEADHTLRFLRTRERWEPELTDRNSWNKWFNNGGKDMRQRAREKAKRILSKHHPVYVSEKEAKEIDKIAQKAQEDLMKEG